MADIEDSKAVIAIANMFKASFPRLSEFEAMTLALKFHKNLCILAAAPIRLPAIEFCSEEDDLTSQN